MMIKALVLGSNGYVGRHVTHAARAAGWDVQTTDLQPAAWDSDPCYLACDVRQRSDLEKLDWDVDMVFVFSGLSGTTVGFEKYEDYIDVNEKGLVGILECARVRAGDRAKIVFPSSRLVYRGVPGKLREDAEKASLTVYAVNKRAGEMYLGLYEQAFGLRHTIFRICVPYANLLGGEYSYGTMGFFLRYAHQGNDIPLYGDGSQRRTFTHIEDLCSQVLAASVLPQSDNQVFNVGGGDDLSIYEAAEQVARRFGVGIKLTPWPEIDSRCESGDTVFDAAAIQLLTGYQCRHRLADWINGLQASKSTGSGFKR
jgi:UDP-glucose 4-epimerase